MLDAALNDALAAFADDAVRTYFFANVGLTAVTFVFAAVAIALSVASFGHLTKAERARDEAVASKRAAQDLAVEVRHLTAQVERALAAAQTRGDAPARPPKLAGGGALGASPVRVGANHDSGEAEVEIVGASSRGETGPKPDDPRSSAAI